MNRKALALALTVIVAATQFYVPASARASLAGFWTLTGTLTDFDERELRIRDYGGVLWAIPRSAVRDDNLRPGQLVRVRARAARFRRVAASPGRREDSRFAEHFDRARTK